jgi:hypothetical protein
MPDTDLGVCTMCEQAPATTTWFAPVCQPCADMLGSLDADLKEMEAADPALAEMGRRVEESARRVFDWASEDMDEEPMRQCPYCKAPLDTRWQRLKHYFLAGWRG